MTAKRKEPVVLPADFPNLLANGSSGIAVGMATSIPPHNAEELCDAALHLIKHPRATIEKLIEFVPGPDFPTGGVLVEDRNSILEAYRTGRGGFRLRAKWEKEETGRGTYCDRHHGNSLSGAKITADRKDCRIAGSQAPAAARRYSR